MRDGQLVFPDVDLLILCERLIRYLVLIHAVEEQLVAHREVRVGVVDQIEEGSQEFRFEIAFER